MKEKTLDIINHIILFLLIALFAVVTQLWTWALTILAVYEMSRYFQMKRYFAERGFMLKQTLDDNIKLKVKKSNQ